MSSKISGLTAGAPAQATDLHPISRGAANYSLQNSDIATYVLSQAIPNTSLGDGIINSNTALQSQVVSSGTAYYITNSNINVPASPKTGIVVGTTMWWDVIMTKTAAGTGTFQIVIYTGTNGTTSDTASVSQSIGTQTAAVDTMRLLVKIVFTAVGASGSFFWSITPITKAATAAGFGVATGTGVFTGTVSSFNTTTSNLKFGLGFIATTGTPTITIPCVLAQSFNLV